MGPEEAVRRAGQLEEGPSLAAQQLAARPEMPPPLTAAERSFQGSARGDEQAAQIDRAAEVLGDRQS